MASIGHKDSHNSKFLFTKSQHRVFRNTSLAPITESISINPFWQQQQFTLQSRLIGQNPSRSPHTSQQAKMSRRMPAEKLKTILDLQPRPSRRLPLDPLRLILNSQAVAPATPTERRSIRERQITALAAASGAQGNEALFTTNATSAPSVSTLLSSRPSSPPSAPVPALGQHTQVAPAFTPKSTDSKLGCPSSIFAGER